MSDKFNELIELIISEDEDKARDLFHEIVVEKSREIYENLDEESVEDEAVEEATDEEVEESDFDEEGLGGDMADDMIDDIEADEEGLAVEADADDEEIEDRVVDLEDALDELKAEFEKIMGGEDDADDEEGDIEDMDMDMDADEEGDVDMDMDMDADEEVEEDSEIVREYAEKAPAPVTSEEGDGKAGPVAKNAKAPSGAKAHPAQTGEESGGSTPKYDDANMTTEPDMKKV
tara:strand:- start:77 stop:772 length:696 start_codon:yes stop_codon:yes gene_type:complete